MRVFLDTNVLVSAFATRGLSADVFRLVLAEHELIVGEIVVEEVRRVLGEKIGLPGRAVEEALALLEEHRVVPTAGTDPGGRYPILRTPECWPRRWWLRPMFWSLAIGICSP